MNEFLNNDAIPDLTQQMLEQLICVESSPGEPCIFLLKTHQSPIWHRFFLDVGVCFWHQFDELPEDDLEDESYPWYDMVLRNNLQGCAIHSIYVEPYQSGCKIVISLERAIRIEISTEKWDDITKLQLSGV